MWGDLWGKGAPRISGTEILSGQVSGLVLEVRDIPVVHKYAAPALYHSIRLIIVSIGMTIWLK